MPGAPRPRGPSIAKSPHYLEAAASSLRWEFEGAVTEEERLRAEAFVRAREAARQRPTKWEMMWISWMHLVEGERHG